MYTVTITYRDTDNKVEVDIFDNISTISVDGNIVGIWDKDNKYEHHKYENILIIQIVNNKLL